jgi:hypothetical protein
VLRVGKHGCKCMRSLVRALVPKTEKTRITHSSGCLYETQQPVAMSEVADSALELLHAAERKRYLPPPKQIRMRPHASYRVSATLRWCNTAEVKSLDRHPYRLRNAQFSSPVFRHHTSHSSLSHMMPYRPSDHSMHSIFALSEPFRKHRSNFGKSPTCRQGLKRAYI